MYESEGKTTSEVKVEPKVQDKSKSSVEIRS